jgi:outer membrane protein assembly factor BamB
MTRFFLTTLLLLAPALVSAAPLVFQPDAAAQVDGALSDLGLGDGARVQSAALSGGTLRVDFSPETAAGLDDARAQEVTGAVRAAYFDVEGIEDFSLTVGGRPIASYLPPVPVVVPQAGGEGQALVPGPLSGKTIVVSPGHGWYWYAEGSTDQWLLQRSYYFGIVEDFMNQEMVQYVYNLLVNAGATVYSTREMEKSAGTAASAINFAGVNRPAPNKPWWQMAALYNVRRLGAPSSVWNNGRTTDYNRDIAARPLYANYRNADLMVSLHNNAFNGTGVGTETLYDTGNGYGTASKKLAEAIQTKVVGEIRANYNSGWANRGAKGFDGSYGENRIATRPAALIEVAFFDTEKPDSEALRDENFRLLVAKGIYEGICSYFGVTPVYRTNITGPAGPGTAQPLAKLWEVNTGDPLTSPVSASDGVAFAGSRTGVLYSVAATAASGRSAGTALWKYPATGNLGAPILARPTVYGDTVYIAAANGRLAAVDRASGAARWSITVPNNGGLTSAPSPTADGILFIGSDNGRVYCYNSRTGAAVRASANTFGAIAGTVAVPDDSRVWVTSQDGFIRRLSNDLQTVLWSADAGVPVSSSPYVDVAGNSVYVTSRDAVYALDAGTGNPKDGWPAGGAAQPGAPIGVSPWVDAAAGRVLFATDNHQVRGVLAATGLAANNLPLRPAGVKEFTGAPVVANGMLYVGGTDGKFYALDLDASPSDPGAGWRVFDSTAERLPGQFLGSPAVTGSGPDDVALAANTNGRIYAFGR